MSEFDYLTIEEACKHFRVSKNTVRKLLKLAPEGCAWRVGKVIRIVKSTMGAWLATNPARIRTRAKRIDRTVAIKSDDANVSTVKGDSA